MAQFTFEIFESEYTLYMMYFTNVANSFSLKQNIEKFECAFINPELVCSVHQILQAANRALFNSINNMPKFQSIYLDMIYFLAPFHTLNECLAYYGIQDNSDAFIVASFNPETLETVRTAVEGQVTKIDSMSDQLDLKKLKKLYGIEGSQAFVDSDIIYTIISTLSIKDVKVSESKF